MGGDEVGITRPVAGSEATQDFFLDARGRVPWVLVLVELDRRAIRRKRVRAQRSNCWFDDVFHIVRLISRNLPFESTRIARVRRALRLPPAPPHSPPHPGTHPPSTAINSFASRNHKHSTPTKTAPSVPWATRDLDQPRNHPPPQACKPQRKSRPRL